MCLAEEVRPLLPSPTPFSNDASSQFHQEALEVYYAVKNATPEQRAIAEFWSDDPGITATPPRHSVSILAQLLEKENVALDFAAIVCTKIGISLADGFVSCWHTKYITNYIRPVSYIRAEIDPAWSSVLNTPPFPEYSSGHSLQSGATAEILEGLFGLDYAFQDKTHENRRLEPRSFSSFAAFAQEAAMSRLYGGIHFRPVIESGVIQGRAVAKKVNMLQFHKGGKGV